MCRTLKKALSDKYVEQLYGIFESKSWNVQELGKYSVFDRFCERLAELEMEEARQIVILRFQSYLESDWGLY